MTDLDLLRAALPAYEVTDVLGRGAWGVVVAGHHRALDRPVAVKMLPLAFTQDDNVRRRFAAEARVLASFDHPHVVRIHDYIEQDEVCALVMERLTGGTLAERMQLGRIGAEQASAIQLATLNGLEHAHQHGVLHRDIKPENLMFAADGVLKITDFGIATMLGAQAERLTATGVAMGTPAYMAPEQLDDPSAVGEATDIWAAAAVYYELLTGAVPYPSRGTLRASLLARARDDPQPIDSVDPDVPRDLGRAVMRALDRDPSKRFATSAEFAAAIETAGTKLWGNDWVSATSTPVYKAAARSTSDGATTTGVVTTRQPGRSTGGRSRHQHRKTNLIIAASAAAIVAAGVSVGVVAFTGDNGSNKSSSGDRGLYWGSWIGNNSIAVQPTFSAGLGPVPAQWGNRLEIGINLDTPRLPGIGSHFGKGISAEIGFAGDPLNGPSWDRPGAMHVDAASIRALETQGSAPYVTYYVQRDIGRGIDNDAAEQDLLNQLENKQVMAAYWANVIKFLKELAVLDQPIPVNLEPGVSSTVESLVGDPVKAKAIVGSAGVTELASLPDTFAGWTQAWVKLRDKYARKVMLGLNLESWASGDYLIPFSPSYTDASIPDWTKGFGKFYNALGARYDFINYVVAYGEAGKQTTKDGNYYPSTKDFDRLVTYVTGLAQQASTRVVLEQIPMGNTIMAPMNNTNHHWQDGYAQWLFGDGSYRNLTRMRDAGVIGLVFGFGYSSEDVTCPCDAAHDGQTQGVGPTAVPTGQLSASSDDDGGYLRDRVAAYLATGGMALS